jgi:hypothetical protein
MNLPTSRAALACLLLLFAVAWGQPGAASEHTSLSACAAEIPREQTRAERIARARNCGPGSVDVYEYVGVSMYFGPFESDGFIIDAAEGVHWRGHAGVALRMCEPTDAFHCFDGPALSFSVPKAPMSVKQSWSRFDKSYVVIAQGSMRLLGRSIDVHVIESVDDLDRKHWFYFSDEFGLVAIVSSESERTYYAKELYGYPRAAPAATDKPVAD